MHTLITNDDPMSRFNKVACPQYWEKKKKKSTQRYEYCFYIKKMRPRVHYRMALYDLPNFKMATGCKNFLLAKSKNLSTYSYHLICISQDDDKYIEKILPKGITVWICDLGSAFRKYKHHCNIHKT